MAEHIYKNRMGKRVPSVTTILSRFKESGGLLYWANTQGLEGKTLEEARRPAATAGTLAHDMVEAHIHGLAEPTLNADPEIVAKARRSFDSYLTWSKMSQLEVLYTETALVSETHQFGGRMDGVGVVRSMGNGLAIVDFKTSNGIYVDYTLQIAAYSILWNEVYPDNPITGGFHICRFAKEEGDYGHHFYPDLEHERKTFLKMRDLYDAIKVAEKRVK